MPARSPAFPTTSAASGWSRCIPGPTCRRPNCGSSYRKPNLPKLWIPKRENIYQVDALPSLGTGKLDLVGVKAKAQQLAAAAPVSS